jgi:CheY-like chemotaxis protein
MAIPGYISSGSRIKAGPSPHSASQTMGVPNDPGVQAGQPRPVPSDILIVEDNFIIALDLEAMLRDLGVESIRTANSVHAALEIIAAKPPQFGLIDVNLGEEKCFDIAERLRELGIPFVFTTGYGDSYAFPLHFAETRIMSKPYTVEALRDMILSDPAPEAS